MLYSMKLSLITIALIICMTLTQPVVTSLIQCPCLNEGACLSHENQTFCDCNNDYIGTKCQIQSHPINQTQQSFGIPLESIYFHTIFNSSGPYFIQVYFCPGHNSINRTFAVSAFLEQKNGSLIDNVSDKKGHSFTVINQTQCFSFRGSIFLMSDKYNNKLPRLIVKMKRISNPLINQNNPSGNTTLDQIPSIRIAVNVFDYFYFQPLVLGQYIAVSMIIFLIGSSISFLICRKLMLRRVTRYQRAEVVNCTQHFDQLMPVTFNKMKTSQELNQEQQSQCMICLLTICGTQTRQTPCGHLYHKDCIDEWGKKSLTCPMCRHSLAKQDQPDLLNPSLQEL